MFKILSGILIILAVQVAAVSGQTEKTVAEIEALLDKTNRQIAESNAEGEYSSIFLAETFVNKNNGSYPAVGVFRTVYRFYYTYGDREKNPYPNRLLKIEIETKRSDRTEMTEFLFGGSGQLVFYSEKTGEREIRLYLAAEKPLKFLKDGENTKLAGATAVRAAKAALVEKRKLAGFFSALLDYRGNVFRAAAGLPGSDG